MWEYLSQNIISLYNKYFHINYFINIILNIIIFAHMSEINLIYIFNLLFNLLFFHLFF